MVPPVPRHTRRRPRAPHIHPLLVCVPFSHADEKSFCTLSWKWGRLAFPSLKFLSKYVCVFGGEKNEKHILTREDALFFFEEAENTRGRMKRWNPVGAAGGFYFSHILTEESEAWTHQRVFFRPLMRTRLGFVIEFGHPGSIITTTKNLVQLFVPSPSKPAKLKQK